MARKATFNKQEITEKAFLFVRRNGMRGLTVRRLAKEIGSSTKPISHYFSSMEELKNEIKKEAKELYSNYVEKGENDSPSHPFRGVGKAYIRFAKEEPNLFYLLFMSERKEKGDNAPKALQDLDPKYKEILQSVKKSYSLADAEEETAKSIYVGMWALSHGIASLSVSKTFSFDDEEIQEIFQKAIIGFLPKKK